MLERVLRSVPQDWEAAHFNLTATTRTLFAKTPGCQLLAITSRAEAKAGILVGHAWRHRMARIIRVPSSDVNQRLAGSAEHGFSRDIEPSVAPATNVGRKITAFTADVERHAHFHCPQARQLTLGVIQLFI